VNATQRRMAGIVAVALLIALTAFSVLADSKTISVKAAHARALAGEIVLIDIRHRSEWRSTGVGSSAVAISMHEPGFLERVKAAVKGDKSRPVALICAAGVRSKRMSEVLIREGYKTVIDVSEGMLGGFFGGGWLRAGLPVRPFSGN